MYYLLTNKKYLEKENPTYTSPDRSLSQKSKSLLDVQSGKISSPVSPFSLI